MARVTSPSSERSAQAANGENLVKAAIENVQYIHEKSFQNFSFNWTKHSSIYEHPILTKTGVIGTHKVQNIVDAGLATSFTVRLDAFVKDFITNKVVPRLFYESDAEDFLNLFSEFYDYMTTVYHWLLAFYEDFGTVCIPDRDISFARYCRKLALSTLYDIIKERLQTAYRDSLAVLRSRHPYSSVWMYKAYGKGYFLKLIELVAECAAQDEVKTFWWDQHVEGLRKHLDECFNYLQENIRERDYLVFCTQCIDAETRLLKRFPQPADDWMIQVHRELRDLFCEEHFRRSMMHIFFSTVDFLDDSDKKIDKYMFGDLVDLHMRSSKHRERFLCQMKQDVRKRLVELYVENEFFVDITFSPWPLKEFRRFLDRFSKYEQRMSSRLSSLLEDFPEMQQVINECSINLFESLQGTFVGKVLSTQEKVVEFICRRDQRTKKHFLMEAEYCRRFFVHLADQNKMMEDFEKFARKEIGDGRAVEVHDLAIFLAMKDVLLVVPVGLRRLLEDNCLLKPNANV